MNPGNGGTWRGSELDRAALVAILDEGRSVTAIQTERSLQSFTFDRGDKYPPLRGVLDFEGVGRLQSNGDVVGPKYFLSALHADTALLQRFFEQHLLEVAGIAARLQEQNRARVTGGVNVLHLALRRPTLLQETLESTRRQSGVLLGLEILEDTPPHLLYGASSVLEEEQDNGHSLLVDDYLADGHDVHEIVRVLVACGLRIDGLKIDGKHVKALENNPRAQAEVEGAFRLARTLGVGQVTCEGAPEISSNAFRIAREIAQQECAGTQIAVLGEGCCAAAQEDALEGSAGARQPNYEFTR
jgi:EAL domain-containing protein (putative c-di-GMP-specific phosphodiesterase class I)